ncbi:hypothetical protein [Bradyrhizobium neotropicale]|uniref:hypothetical protein n=1 Tax=Bradyrhizobium neotropicale TaxID=1497615 RepID=UPI0011AB79D3|nr:hypothetical protein [Bradyrhizobium neotropicale]
MSLFHVNAALLQPGAVILPGNWGRVIRQAGWQHGRSVFEVALEDQRLRTFPHLPSRLDCSFFFDDVEEARFYRLAQNQHTHNLYEVELVDPRATLHCTDWRNISPSGSLDNDWTYRYWAPVYQPPIHQTSNQSVNQPPNVFQCREVLAVTSLMIVAALP